MSAFNRVCMAGVVLAVAGSTMFACSSEPQFAPQPTVDAGYAPPPPPPTVVDAGPPPVASAPCDPVQSLAVTTMFQGRATAEAPNMKPEGGVVCGVVQEGSSFSGQSMMLEQGYCYTVLGQSLPGVSDIDLELVIDTAAIPPALQPFLQGQSMRIAVDSGEISPTTAIGAKQNCYQWPFPIPAMVKVVAKAHTGSGPVAAQVYKKKKF